MKVCWLSAGVSSFIAGYLVRDTVDRFIYIDIDDQHPDSMRFIKDCEIKKVPENCSTCLYGRGLGCSKQSYLKACENIIGLKRGILSDVEAVERTAKEISSSEGDYSLSIMDLQRMWYDALLETLRITDLWGQALGLCDAQAVDLEQLLSVSWGNGVLYDADKDWADTLSMVEAGLLKPELALAKKYDLPSETPEDLAAIREKYMPEMVQLTAQAGLR